MLNKTKDQVYLEICKVVSQLSKDEKTQIGCLILGRGGSPRSWGYNSFPRKINDDVPERQECPEKYYWIEHAERNAIYNAARSGVSLLGCVLYIPVLACADCARAIIQAGITKVVCGSNIVPKNWFDGCSRGLIMFHESGVYCNFTEAIKSDEWGDKKNDSNEPLEQPSSVTTEIIKSEQPSTKE